MGHYIRLLINKLIKKSNYYSARAILVALFIMIIFPGMACTTMIVTKGASRWIDDGSSL